MENIIAARIEYMGGTRAWAGDMVKTDIDIKPLR